MPSRSPLGDEALTPFSHSRQGKDVELLFGLDMLKRHQACIDLQKDALVIQGREIRFLSEHELPKSFGADEDIELDE